MNAKKIQIEMELFVDLLVYVSRHKEPDDMQYQRIIGRAKSKIEALMRHDLYSSYKSGATQEERAYARRKYLDAIGLLADFCWNDDLDVNVTRKEL